MQDEFINQSVVCATEVCGQALGISWNSLTGYATSLCVCVCVSMCVCSLDFIAFTDSQRGP